MPIDSLHPQYVEHAGQWKRCRDVIAGSDAVKRAGTDYLPRLEGQSKKDYDAYKKRALFFSVAGRSLQGLLGTVTRRSPTITKVERMDQYFNDISLTKTSFVEIFNVSCEQLLSVGRYGMLADVGIDGGRAYVSSYTTENILNWRYDIDGNLISLVLREVNYEVDPNDQFLLTEVTSYRHLYINNDGNYAVMTYDVDGKPTSSEIVPTAKGDPLKEIPFVSITPFGLSLGPEKPPILDIVDVNLSQYLSSADLENGRHFIGLPTPIVTGADVEGKLQIGGTAAWVIPNDKAKAYYLEFLGQGLASLEHAIAEKTGQMAQFSARLMDTSTRGSEAADTVRLRHSADAATLSSMAIALEAGYNTIYEYLAMFEGSEAPTIELNRDFLDTKLSPTELKELTASYLSGAIDAETYFYNLQRGELVPQGKKDMSSSIDKTQ